MSDKYQSTLDNITFALVTASEEAGTPLSPLMVVADLAIQVLAEHGTGGDFEKFKAAVELFFRRIENNVDAEIERMWKARN